MARMRLTGVQRAGLVGAVAAGAALGVAIGSETWAGLVPCALCLVERWPYRVVTLLGVLAVVAPRGARVLVALSAAAMLAGAAAGMVHVGVEAQWWPSPLPECAAPALGGGTMAERLARMPARPAKPCDEPTYLLPVVPLSMAGMNLVLSSIMGTALAAAALRLRSVP